jgi:hypothetical protein
MVTLGSATVPIAVGAQSLSLQSQSGALAPPQAVPPAPQTFAPVVQANKFTPDGAHEASVHTPGSAQAASPSAPDGVREASAGAAAGAAPAIKPVLKGLGAGGMSAAAQKLNPLMMRALKQFEAAKASFTGFCEDWHRKLAEREVNNLAHIAWRLQNGVETGSYVSYGPIESCTCKQANNGVPIGELTYKEMDYTLSGKTVEEAKHAKPSVTVVPTREIFSWDKGKWFY